ncbi:MAG: DUF2975 domain-containing protein [Caulobacter sp.]|nr:DUF2975 domain-containing protein [Caulobacter sp.]
MRALGPGSVSSFLKFILDVAYYVLLVSLAGLAIISVAGLLLSFNPAFLRNLDVSGEAGKIVAKGPVLAATLAYSVFYVGSLLAIIGGLRRVFATLTGGDPFHPDNIRRLRFIGFVLAGMELARHAFQAILGQMGAGAEKGDDGVSVTAWFAVLVIFVLAEVFREGARLRHEAELTI